MNAGSHRIRRLRWRVRVGSPDEAFSVRPRLRRSATRQILPALGQLFDEISPGTDVHIERMEVQLRAEAATLEQDCLDAIRAQLTERLQTLARRPPSEAPRVDAVRARIVEALLQYLRSGALPWHVAAVAENGWTRAALTEAARQELSTVVGQMPIEREAAAMFAFRLLALVPERTWVAVGRAIPERFAHDRGDELLAALEEIARARESGLSRHARLQLAAALIALARARETGPGTARQLGSLGALPAAPSIERLFTSTPAIAALMSTQGVIHATDSTARVPALDTSEVRQVARRKGLWKEPPPDTCSSPSESFGVAVAHAGLVLLAPFVARLFDVRHIARAHETRIPAGALPRACALLHLAATGHEDGQEFDLGFIKILLGLRCDAPVPFSPGLLTTADRDEVHTLLGAVVEHWSVLKRTSADALRTAFLQRSGLIFDDPICWRLQVESSSIDLLLDHLPWGIRTVTLPWLSKPIHAEWTTR